MPEHCISADFSLRVFGSVERFYWQTQKQVGPGFEFVRRAQLRVSLFHVGKLNGDFMHFWADRDSVFQPVHHHHWTDERNSQTVLADER